MPFLISKELSIIHLSLKNKHITSSPHLQQQERPNLWSDNRFFRVTMDFLPRALSVGEFWAEKQTVPDIPYAHIIWLYVTFSCPYVLETSQAKAMTVEKPFGKLFLVVFPCMTNILQCLHNVQNLGTLKVPSLIIGLCKNLHSLLQQQIPDTKVHKYTYVYYFIKPLI